MKQDMHLGTRRSSRLTSPDDNHTYCDRSTDQVPLNCLRKASRRRSYSWSNFEVRSSKFEVRSPKSELRPKEMTMIGALQPLGKTPRGQMGRGSEPQGVIRRRGSGRRIKQAKGSPKGVKAEGNQSRIMGHRPLPTKGRENKD